MNGVCEPFTQRTLDRQPSSRQNIEELFEVGEVTTLCATARRTACQAVAEGSGKWK